MHARTEREQALAIASKQLLVHARAIVKALQVSPCHQLQEVLVALTVLGEQNQVETSPGFLPSCLETSRFSAVETRAGRNVDLTPDDRLYAGFPACTGELHNAEQNPVISYCQLRHAKTRRPDGQFRDPAKAVKKAEFGVYVKMRELGGHPPPHLNPREDLPPRYSIPPWPAFSLPGRPVHVAPALPGGIGAGRRVPFFQRGRPARQ